MNKNINLLIFIIIVKLIHNPNDGAPHYSLWQWLIDGLYKGYKSENPAH